MEMPRDLSSEGQASLQSLGEIKGKIKVTKDAVIRNNNTLSAKITSFSTNTSPGLYLVSKFFKKGIVRWDGWAWGHLGDIKDVQLYVDRTAKLTSWNNLTGWVNAGKDVTLTVLNDITTSGIGIRSRTGGVTIETNNLTGNVETLGQVGKPDITVTSWGRVEALGNLAGEVVAATDVSAFALDSITALVSAGNDASVSSMGLGGIIAPIDAGNDVRLFAAGDLAATVDAGGNAMAMVQGAIASNIDAGGTAIATAYDYIDGDITAGNHALAQAFLRIKGNIEAETGNAIALSHTHIENDVSAGNSALVWVNGPAKVGVQAVNGQPS